MSLNVPEGFGIAALRFSLINDAEEMVTTFGVLDGGDSQDNVDSIADLFAAAFDESWISLSYTFKGATLRHSFGDGTYSVWEAPRNLVGEAAATTCPQNVSFLVRKLTARAGRAGRGRFYFPPFMTAEDAVNAAGVVSTGALSAIQGQLDTWFASQDMYLFHDSGSPLSGEADSITNLVLDQRVATQRRRLRP